MTAPTYSTRRREQVQRAAQEWRAALIDVSGNNRLLFFKPTGATLDLADAAPAALAELLAGTTVRLSRLFPDPIRQIAAQRAVKNLAGKQREAAEEYGVSVAFCAFGLATWSRNPDDALAEVDVEAAVNEATGEMDLTRRGQDAIASPDPPGTGGRRQGRSLKGPTPPAAPVLLRALELSHRPGSADAWQLTLTGEAQLNPVLIHVMGAQGATLNEEDILESGDDTRGEFEPIFGTVRKACADVPGFSIERRSMLGAFSYLKQPMVADCEDIEALLTSDLVAALAGDEDAIAAVRTLHGDVAETDPDYKPVDSEFLVLDADASQSFVVNAALAGRNLVVQGPPGTGKSQTIGNVIAGLVAEGKRVLFVAQKRAAITAVLDRLETVGLHEVTLDLFAAGASRRYVADQLRDVLDAQSVVGIPVTDGLHRTLTGSRDLLVAHRNALHLRRHAWGVTVAGLLALTRTIPSSATTGLRLPLATLTSWGESGLELPAEQLGELVGKGGLATDRLTRVGWSVTNLTSAEAVAAANELLVEVTSTRLPTARAAFAAVAAEFGGQPPAEVVSAASFLRGLAECAALDAAVPGALDPALPAEQLEAMLAATDKAYRKAHSIKLGWGARRKARKAAHALLRSGDDGDAATHALLLRAKASRAGWAKRGGVGTARSLPALPAAQQALTQLHGPLSTLQGYVQNVVLDALPFDQLEAQLAALAADRSRGQLPRLHELELALNAAGLGPLLTTLRRGTAVGGGSGAAEAAVGADPVAAANLLRYIAVHSALETALTTDPALAGVSGAELDAAAEQFQRCDDDHLAANAARVRRAAATRLTATLDANPMQHMLVRKEVTKKRNFMAVRTLFDQAPQVMGALKPVWAMSPLQVSRLLPASRCFDVVIFDEASQVKPADAIPALVRAPQVIVAGDSRQLPPTEFFTKVLEDPPDAPGPAAEADVLAAQAEQEDAALGEAAAAPEPARPIGESFTRDAESILFAFDRVLAGQSRQLLWHYRSRDERLIAVSNAFVYRSTLTTFPAADGHQCLQYVSLPPSPGIKGGTNSPEAEVARVVELVIQHARTRPEESLGVITFGIPHTRRIEAALEAAFEADPELETVLDANAREPFFVKNIERVQGDERDAIILSVGYGKPVDGGKIRLFWGPLLTPGGERRLNVAISRAKSRVTLVTSFGPDDVAEDAHASAGFALMYRFLRFMASGGTELSGDGLRLVELNAFELDMFDRLTAAGLDLVPQLGVGSYRLDFAARHPRLPGRYVLAIEADGAAYHSGHVARERDRLRQRLLEGRGWTFHRIWSTNWFNDADAEVAATVAAFEVAIAAYDAGTDVPSPIGDGEETTADGAGEASWHVAAAKRKLPRPNLRRGLTIDRYEPAKLAALVRHVRSDGVLRTRDEELAVLMRELGFVKRGPRIVAALTAAQNAAD